MKKYLKIFQYGLKMNLVYLPDYLFSLIAFFVHVLVFNALWDFILKDGTAAGYARNELIWYIIMAEFITYSIASSYRKIADRVKDGTIANMLIKPIHYPLYFLAEESSNLLKIVVNLIGLFGLGFWLGGRISISMVQLGLILVSILFSLLNGVLTQLILGLIAFSMEEVKSIWLITQKLQFFLVFVPLEFYTKWAQRALSILPTTYTAYVPARLLVKFEVHQAISLIGVQVIWVAILALVSAILYKKGVRKINANGG